MCKQISVFCLLSGRLVAWQAIEATFTISHIVYWIVLRFISSYLFTNAKMHTFFHSSHMNWRRSGDSGDNFYSSTMYTENIVPVFFSIPDWWRHSDATLFMYTYYVELQQKKNPSKLSNRNESMIKVLGHSSITWLNSLDTSYFVFCICLSSAQWLNGSGDMKSDYCSFIR